MARNVASSTKWYSRAFASPGRGARVVCETESLSRGSPFSTPAMSELLPAPDGAVTTKRSPCIVFSLDILHLLAHPLDQELELERAIGDLAARRLGGERVRLAVELLGEKVEPLARRAAVLQRPLDFAEVRAEALELLVDVDLRPEHGELGAGATSARRRRISATRPCTLAASFAPSRARAAVRSSSAARHSRSAIARVRSSSSAGSAITPGQRSTSATRNGPACGSARCASAATQIG